MAASAGRRRDGGGNRPTGQLQGASALLRRPQSITTALIRRPHARGLFLAGADGDAAVIATAAAAIIAVALHG